MNRSGQETRKPITFKEVNIKDCIFRIDASQPETIITDNNQEISSVRDLASNSDLKQFNQKKRPRFCEGAIQFNSSRGSYLESGHLKDLEVNEFCFYIVLELNSFKSQLAQHVFSFKFGEGGKKCHAAIEFVWKKNVESFYLNVRNQAGEEIVSALPQAKGRHLFFGGWKNGNVYLRMDGSKTTVTPGADCLLRDHRALYIGDNYYHDPQFALDGQLYEFSLYNMFSENPDTEVALMKKWRIPQGFFDKWKL